MIYTSEPNITKKENLLVEKSLKKNLISSFGNDIARFERTFSKIFDFSNAIALNSGTSALHVALLVNDVKKNDLVIVPSFSFAATANAVIYCGAEPWFHDIEKNKFSIDIKQVAKSLEKNTFLKNGERFHKITQQRVSCMIPVTTFGNSIDFDEVKKIKKNYKINVIIDGASAHFAKYKNKNLGNTGLDFIFSFNGNKGISTGSGGIYATQKNSKIKKAKILINVGQDKKKYNYRNLGYNYRMNNLQANLGIAQLARYKYFYNQKKKIYQLYKSKIKSTKNIKNFFNLSDGDGYFWVYPLLVKNKHKFLSFLKNKKIILSQFWQSLSKQKPYKNFLQEEVFNSENNTKNIICLPSSTFLSNKELDKIIKIINNFK